MKLVSWNVNGLRACMGKGFADFVRETDADAICLQETKMQPEQAEFAFPGYRMEWNSAIKKGYSGTLTLCRAPVLSVALDIGDPEHTGEGRVIATELEEFTLVNVYTPNAQHGLTRLDYRMRWEDAFRAYLTKLAERKPVIVCGDMNVAHTEIDLTHPKSNVGSPGFTPQERGKMTELLESGFVDSFRHLYSDRRQAYTWWSYRMNAREKNVGWRIDYFLVSAALAGRVKESAIYPEVFGSDHCPIALEIG